MKKILFIFDRVAHYHQELFKGLEKTLPTVGLELYLLSGESNQANKGRVGLGKSVIEKESKFTFHEYKIGSFILRRHSGVLDKVREIQPDIVVVLSHIGNVSHWQLMGLKRKMGFKLVAWQCGYEYNPGTLKDFLLGKFIPQFDLVKQAALQNGALGSGISGSGPSIFALSKGKETAEKVANAMKTIFEGTGIPYEIHVSKINSEGVKII